MVYALIANQILGVQLLLNPGYALILSVLWSVL